MRDEESAKLTEIIADILGLDAGAVSDALTPDGVEQWTSLNHLRVITAVEEAFSIAFTMEQIESIDSVGALRRLVGELT